MHGFPDVRLASADTVALAASLTGCDTQFVKGDAGLQSLVVRAVVLDARRQLVAESRERGGVACRLRPNELAGAGVGVFERLGMNAIAAATSNANTATCLPSMVGIFAVAMNAFAFSVIC